jgi:hypothetical protein
VSGKKKGKEVDREGLKKSVSILDREDIRRIRKI